MLSSIWLSSPARLILLSPVFRRVMKPPSSFRPSPKHQSCQACILQRRNKEGKRGYMSHPWVSWGDASSINTQNQRAVEKDKFRAVIEIILEYIYPTNKHIYIYFQEFIVRKWVVDKVMDERLVPSYLCVDRDFPHVSSSIQSRRRKQEISSITDGLLCPRQRGTD